jgi:hypothetical protein
MKHLKVSAAQALEVVLAQHGRNMSVVDNKVDTELGNLLTQLCGMEYFMRCNRSTSLMGRHDNFGSPYFVARKLIASDDQQPHIIYHRGQDRVLKLRLDI